MVRRMSRRPLFPSSLTGEKRRGASISTSSKKEGRSGEEKGWDLFVIYGKRGGKEDSNSSKSLN